MSIKDAMAIYFKRQADAHMAEYNTLPMIPFDREKQTLIYKGQVDEENWIQWKPVHAKAIKIDGLCQELNQFYSTYYYGRIEGLFENIYYDFPGIFNQTNAISQAKWALRNGEDLFPNENVAVIAICEINGKDGLLLAYEQDTNRLFIWDGETNDRNYLEVSLEELILNLTTIP